MKPPPVTPETRVGELLDAYPQAEQTLIAIAPKFRALKNPVLRRTVAKVATLEQAARVADLPVDRLVRALREALGQDVGETIVGGAADPVEGDAPAWSAGGARHELDADLLLAAGAVPVARATELLAGMAAGEVLLVRSSFHVAPLVDALRAKGHEVAVRRLGEDVWETWVRKS